MKIVLVEPGKAARAAEIEDGLAAMQEIVGGPIQAIYPWEDPVALVCNEEGKLIGLPLNRGLENFDVVAGTFFICGIRDDRFSSLTQQQTQQYLRKFRYPERFIHTPMGTLCLRLEPLDEPKKKEKKPHEHER